MDLDTLGIIAITVDSVITVCVAVASYRRGRHLSGYPIWRSVVIAVIAGCYWPIWLIVWWVNRKLFAARWAEWRAARVPV